MVNLEDSKQAAEVILASTRMYCASFEFCLNLIFGKSDSTNYKI